MKVDLKINYETLKLLCDLYDGITEIKSYQVTELEFEKDYKAVKNIIDILFIKLKKKLLTKNENSKLFKLSVDYFQAYFLTNFLSTNSCFFKGVFEQNELLQVITKLHQQL